MASMIRAGYAADGDRATDDRRTGIELAWRSLRMTPPRWWDVTDAVSGRRVARVQQRWGFTRVPPGVYRVEARLGEAIGASEKVEVRPGHMTRVTPGDLGLGRLTVEWPAAQGVVMPPGLTRLEARFEQEGQSRPLSLEKPGDRQLSLWARRGRATVHFRLGATELDEPVDVVPGAARLVPFDTRALAAKLGLSAVSVVLRGPSGQVASRGTRVTMLDARGERLLALTTDPPPGTTWLVPPGPVVRAQVGDRELVRRDVPPDVKADLVFDFAPPAQPGGRVPIQVDVDIESPAEGTIVEQDRTTVIGRASTTGPAGATRVALVLDISLSTTSSCGADLDGDGREENIFQAEAAAGRVLLDELAKVEAKSPGTAFEVTIVRFAATATALTPLTPMTDAKGVASLRAALDRIVRDGSQSGTNYAAAFDEATRALKAAERPGHCVILLMSDGAPNELRPSLDAAARAGLAGVIVHTFGLGRDFLGRISPRGAVFPPEPPDPVNVLAAVAALGGPTGTVTALPRPADVIPVIPRLPVLDLPEAKLKEVQVVDATTGKPAFSVQLAPDGAFQAEVPISLLPAGPHETNVLVATAVALDGISKADDRVTVRCPPQPGTVAVLYRTREGGPPLPRSLMPACELILDSSHSMIERVKDRPKFEIARAVLEDLTKSLPEGCNLGLRVYGHLGFLGRHPGRKPPRPDPKDPRLNTDSQLIEPISALDGAKRLRIKQVVDESWPRGNTPLVYSLLRAKEDFPAGWRGTKLVVLVSDGEETCGGKIEDVAAAYRGSGVEVVIHVVGFDIRGIAVKQQLEEIARIGGGRYFDARDAGQLAKALRDAVAGAASFAIESDDGKTRVARGVINGPAISLKPGGYRIGFIDDTAEPLRIRIRSRQKLELLIDEAGRLVAPGEAGTPEPVGTPNGRVIKPPSGS
jgi:hypothetical protein